MTIYVTPERGGRGKAATYPISSISPRCATCSKTSVPVGLVPLLDSLWLVKLVNTDAARSLRHCRTNLHLVERRPCCTVFSYGQLGNFIYCRGFRNAAFPRWASAAGNRDHPPLAPKPKITNPTTNICTFHNSTKNPSKLTAVRSFECPC
jgi:hypothetical protein